MAKDYDEDDYILVERDYFFSLVEEVEMLKECLERYAKKIKDFEEAGR